MHDARMIFSSSQVPSVEDTDSSSKTLSLLSWNIDGLDVKYPIERALSVCNLIESRKPDVVFLQEIVPLTWEAITRRLKSSYSFYCEEVPSHYCHILLVRKASNVVPQGDLQVVKFSESKQGRFLLQLLVKFHGVDVYLLTSHLESLNQNTVERKKQLKLCFELMGELQSESGACIFAGDLNLMDREVTQVGLPENFVDVWEACGSDFKQKFTWDSSEPRFRLDRIYFCSENSKLQPSRFALVGNELLPKYKMYPSDHLGMWAEFVLKE